MAALLAFVGFVGVIAACSILQGWVLSLLWFWFIVPLGMEPLSIPLAIGFTLVVGACVNYRSNPESSKSKTEVWSSVAMLFLKPLLLLAIGWIVKGFI